MCKKIPPELVSGRDKLCARVRHSFSGTYRSSVCQDFVRSIVWSLQARAVVKAVLKKTTIPKQSITPTQPLHHISTPYQDIGPSARFQEPFRTSQAHCWHTTQSHIKLCECQNWRMERNTLHLTSAQLLPPSTKRGSVI